MTIEEKVLNGIRNDVVGREEAEEQGFAEEELDNEEELDELDEIDEPESDEEGETDDEEEEDGEEDEAIKPRKPKQSQADNARYAAARREAEKAQRAAEEKYAELEKQLRGQSEGGMTDAEEASIRKNAEAHGKDPDVMVLIEQNKRRDAADRARKAVEQARAIKEKANAERANLEIKEFEAVTGLRSAELNKDPAFADYAEGKWGLKSMLEIYTGYKRLRGETAIAATKAAKERSDRSTSASSTASGGLPASARRALDEWNKRNPHSKMTEKEYRELLKGD